MKISTVICRWCRTCRRVTVSRICPHRGPPAEVCRRCNDCWRCQQEED